MTEDNIRFNLCKFGLMQACKSTTTPTPPDNPIGALTPDCRTCHNGMF